MIVVVCHTCGPMDTDSVESHRRIFSGQEQHSTQVAVDPDGLSTMLGYRDSEGKSVFLKEQTE